MRNVNRVVAPQSFRNEATKWAQKLRSKLKTGKATDHYFGQYNQTSKKHVRSDMEDSLLAMYTNMCCYCEARTEKKQGEIEHLRPKKRYPEKTYDWGNLHWACADCNGIKLEKFDDINPILDPSEPEPITQHIETQIDEDNLWIWLFEINSSSRGNTTIEHADLNRELLKRARMKIYLKTLKLIDAIKKNNTGAQKLKMNKISLKNLYNGEFGFATTVKAAFSNAGFTYNEI